MPARRLNTAPTTRWFLTISIYRAIRIVEEFFLLCLGRCTAWNTCRCLPWFCFSLLPCYSACHFPPTVCPKHSPSHVVCENDSGILIRHFAFKFNSLGLWSCNCNSIAIGGKWGTERKSVLTHLRAHVTFSYCAGERASLAFSPYMVLWHPNNFLCLLFFYCICC